jgi:hypothetical protein
MHTAFTFTPSDSQEVFEVGFIAGITTAASLQIGVYRVSTLALIAQGTATSPGVGSNTRIAQAITPVALTTGVAYCIAWRQIADGSLFINTGATGSGGRSASLTGANALPSTFNPDGAALNPSFMVFATTQAAAGGASNVPRANYQYRKRRQ